MRPLFDLVERPLDKRTRLLAPRGELDAATNPAFSAAVEACADGDGKRLVVDLSEVSFMSAGAIGIIARAWTRMQRGRGQLIVICPSPRLYELFEIAGLADDLDIVTSREALAA
jgi:anti-anti-sigma factor